MHKGYFSWSGRRHRPRVNDIHVNQRGEARYIIEKPILFQLQDYKDNYAQRYQIYTISAKDHDSHTNMYLKLYYPNKWVETHIIDSQTTVRDVILHILYKKQIPLQFYNSFTIIHTYFTENEGQKLKTKEAKSQYEDELTILQYDMLIEPFVNMNQIKESKFLLYILVQPYNTDLQRLEFTFLQMLYQQSQSEILNNLYPLDDPTKFYKLAAITASYEFGQFDEQKHCQGFFKSSINNFVPLQSTQSAKYQDIEKEIFEAWKVLSPDLQLNKNELALTYLQMLKNIMPQYGSFVIKGTYNKRYDAFYYINQAGIQIRSQNDGKCYFDGKIGSFDQTFRDTKTTTITNLKIGIKKTEHVFQAEHNLDIQQIQSYIQQQSVYQRDYSDQYIEQFIKEQQTSIIQQISPNVSQGQQNAVDQSKVLDMGALCIEQNVLENQKLKNSQIIDNLKSPEVLNDKQLNNDLQKSPPMLFQPSVSLIPPKLQTAVEKDD